MDEFKCLSQEQTDLYCDLNSINVCRICLEKNQNDKMCNIFEGVEPLFTMITSCASVQIVEGDGLPNSICQKCSTQLNIAWQFKLKCESSDVRLRQFYTNSSILPTVVSNINDKIDLNTEEIVTTRLIDELHNTNDDNREENSNNDDDDVDDNTNRVKIRKKNVKNRPNDSKIHQCDTCGKIFNRREYLTQHIRIHTGEKPYCCHICEKRFINSGHLTTHMRTHTGERPHACTLCPKAFSTRQELQKHTMVHNGERPFVCSTCGKSFGSSSNLYSHLKHHTGEKDFTCEHCGKAFYTKQELKQHFVVHTGEKAFACEFCSKRFSQIAHLKRHLKLHVQHSNDC